ncbi:unnamed protein product [Ranitomeya imitator]|uniref:Interferon regulatory factor-3 domain-containing protein n=1 Tax=Ranitomeya imitator TaxID=111125 RepID=A0ABN9LN18_9NEOB|nr:unnamed protein product [Ranitomeya imitator]
MGPDARFGTEPSPHPGIYVLHLGIYVPLLCHFLVDISHILPYMCLILGPILVCTVCPHPGIYVPYPGLHPETQFDVKVYYRGNLVKNTLVKNANGFQLTSSKQPNPESYLEDVTLPPPTMIRDQKAAAEIATILDSLIPGTKVEVREGSICAQRLGKCRSYWAMTDEPTTNEPSPISKTGHSLLYNCQRFVKELIEFIEKQRKESPQYSIWICLGQSWPDGKSWKKKLIMVQVTPTSMQMLHEMSYNIGASSLRSSEVNLQISDSLSLHSTSDLLTFLKEFEEKMECS